MKKISSFSVFAFVLSVVTFTPSFAAANAIANQQAKTEHMRSCLTQGGKKEICACSFDRATAVMSIESLLDLNRAIANQIPADKDNLADLKQITRDCAREIKEGTYVPSSSLPTAPAPTTSTLPALPTPPNLTGTSTGTTTIPSIPAPPSFADLDNLTIPAPPNLQAAAPNFDKDAATKGSENYFTDTEIDAGEDATKAATKAPSSSSYQANSGLDVKVDDLRDKYMGQHDKSFFDAAARGDLKALTAINQYLKSPDILDSKGNTPLLIAVQNGQANAAGFLMGKGANVNHQNKDGQAPLHIATFKGRQDIVQLLLRNKGNVNLAYANGFTPLILALMNRDEVMTQTLIIAGANVKLAMADGNFPIHVATSTNNPKTIEILRNYGADLNVENAQGYTPLMVAASQNRTAAASALLALGADYNRTDIYGRTAAQIAYSLGNQQIVNLVLTVQERQSAQY